MPNKMTKEEFEQKNKRKFHDKYRLEEIQEIDNWKKEQALLHYFNFYEISYEDFEKIEDLLAQRLNIGYPNGIKI